MFLLYINLLVWVLFLHFISDGVWVFMFYKCNRLFEVILQKLSALEIWPSYETPCSSYQVQSCWIMYWTCHTSRIFGRSTCMCRQTMTMQLPSIKSLDLKSQTPYGIIIWTSVHPIVTCSVKSLPNLTQKNDPWCAISGPEILDNKWLSAYEILFRECVGGLS